jgi:hypothetical protein
MALYVAPSIEAYLTRHHNLLKEDNLFVHNGEIHAFPKNPIDSMGTVTVNLGVKIEINCQIIHMFCKFDTQRYNEAPKYTFAYQTRISVDPSPSG